LYIFLLASALNRKNSDNMSYNFSRRLVNILYWNRIIATHFPNNLNMMSSGSILIIVKEKSEEKQEAMNDTRVRNAVAELTSDKASNERQVSRQTTK